MHTFKIAGYFPGNKMKCNKSLKQKKNLKIQIVNNTQKHKIKNTGIFYFIS